MKTAKLIFIVSLFTNFTLGQDYLGYSNESLKLTSNYFNETITLNLHMPETANFSAETTKYPITIIFDSQHERTYPQIINSISLLTNESQIPETIIVGVPFNYKNRYYLTSSKKGKNNSLSGIEKMEKFLFEELIPKLQNEYKANDFITIAGHSRTGFLVNYLTLKHSTKIDVAIALSAFYTDEKLNLENFKTHISNPTNFPNKFRYYYTAGTTVEEEIYLKQCEEISNYIAKNNLPKNLEAHFTVTKNANHMTNYWVSIPSIFIDAFSDYNHLLNDWLYDKLKKDSIKNLAQKFETDLEKTGEKLGYKTNPSITQIFSLASNQYQKKDYKTAVDFIKLGQKYYPNYSDFDLDLIQFYKALKDEKMSLYHKNQYKSKINSRKDISDAEKVELLKNLED